jgi:hypothetical protein
MNAAAEVDDATDDGTDAVWSAASPPPALLGAGCVGMTVGTADDGTVEKPLTTATDAPDEVSVVVVAALVVVSKVGEGIEVTVEMPLTFAGESVVGEGNTKVVGAVVLAAAIDDDGDVDAVVVCTAAIDDEGDADVVAAATAEFGDDVESAVVVAVVDERVDDNDVKTIVVVDVVALLVLVDDVPTVSGGAEVLVLLLELGGSLLPPEPEGVASATEQS